MPKITMLDSTALAGYGALKEGETYDVTDDEAKHLIAAGVAKAGKAETKAEAAPAQQSKPAATAGGTPPPLNKPETPPAEHKK